MCGGVEGGACNFSLPSYSGNASLTYYTLNMGSAEVNCSFPIMGRNPDRIGYIHTGQGQYFGAMNTTDYNNAAVCGACVEVSRDDGRKVTVTIVDQCPIGTNPKCTRGHIDLSQAAFTQVGTTTEGYLGTGNGGAAGRISWKYVPCPVTGNVTFRLKEPANQNWNEILVGNHKTPIKQFEAMIGGMWRPGTRQAYNYWSVSMGNLGAGPWRVRVTDVRNNVVEHSLSPGTAEHPSMGQFAGCM
jgi:expansin (peptidoglycan-binding protein)